MAKKRSRRLRKKLHIEEFQEIGFSVAWRFIKGTAVEDIDNTLDAFIDEAIELNDLAFNSSGYLQWGGLICLQRIGYCTNEHREQVKKLAISAQSDRCKSQRFVQHLVGLRFLTQLRFKLSGGSMLISQVGVKRVYDTYNSFLCHYLRPPDGWRDFSLALVACHQQPMAALCVPPPHLA